MYGGVVHIDGLPIQPAAPRSERAPQDIVPARDNPGAGARQSEAVGTPRREVLAPERAAELYRQAREFSRGDAQARESLDSVPPRNRAAVSAYLDNRPSLSERLGIELVGVDDFA